MARVELIRDFLSAYGVGNVVVLFSYLFEWKHSFVAMVGFASRGENEHFQLHLRAGMWQELSGTFVVSLSAKCISLLIRTTIPCLHQAETFTDFKRLGKKPCVLLHLIFIPLQVKPDVSQFL